MKKLKKFNAFILFGVFLLLYILLFFYVFIFKYVSPLELFSTSREYFRGVNLIPFQTIRSYITDLSSNVVISAGNVMGNIILFIPLGIYLQLIKKNKKVWTSMLIVFLTTLFVEVIQFIFGLGAADIDDIILNCIGGFIGILIYKGLYALLKTDGKVYATLVVSGLVVILTPIIITLMLGLKWKLG